ncbi:uncharacterized protein [Prorops nasuta]|uniref:uncharacterized protein n=1 Tax=Prorops nasuta TaxID=863751 RepID=UPI0034CEF58B
MGSLTECPRSEDPRGNPAWYSKFFEYWRNRNRIVPGKFQLPDCDFFIVGPRRTLRILRPPVRRETYYETSGDRAESINDNFLVRWSRRPHSSGNCRCSFRQSNRISSTEEKILSEELNRIRSSLCEAEITGQGIDELEQTVSASLQLLQVPVEVRERPENGSVGASSKDQDEELAVKNRIVKDLEKYINVLLEEILDDTVKFIAGSGNCRKRSRKREEMTLEKRLKDAELAEDKSFNHISFSFPVDKKCESEKEFDKGYVNPAFIGTNRDPDCLEFYLKGSVEAEVDSGINSVETIEFQQDQEPSLEQSLLRIIDEKLGRTPPEESWGSPSDDQGQGHSVEEEAKREAETIQPGLIKLDDLKEMGETTNEPSFQKLRLEFQNPVTLKVKVDRKEKERSGRPVMQENVRQKNCSSTERIEQVPIELRDYRKRWPEVEETGNDSLLAANKELVTFRKSKKPIIVFLHGFGSTAEVFQHQLRYFSSLGYPCLAPDMLGHGMSSAPDRNRDYHFSKLLRDLDLLLQHYAFKPGQKCVLVAHNYGCSFAAALASKYETNIQQLVLISGGGPTPLAAPSTESAGRCCLRAVLTPFLMCGLHRDILYSARGRQHPYCGPEPMEQWPSHMKYILDGMIWPEGDYAFHRRICTPTLLIHGLRDNKVSLVQECQMERTMAKAFLEAIPAAGHSPMTECPQQLNHMIHCFIDLCKNKKW